MYILRKALYTCISLPSFPVLAVDSYMASFYRNVNSYWKEFGATNLSHVTIVSTGGGHRDYQVRNALSSLKGVGLTWGPQALHQQLSTIIR